jgi:hypothetical protein
LLFEITKLFVARVNRDLWLFIGQNILEKSGKILEIHFGLESGHPVNEILCLDDVGLQSSDLPKIRRGIAVDLCLYD